MAGAYGRAAVQGDATPLEGVRICLIFEHSLSHYTRILQEIAALQLAGASVHLLTSFSGSEQPPAGVARTVSPLEAEAQIPASGLAWRPARIADNIARGVLRRVLAPLLRSRVSRVRVAALRALASDCDLFWVIDFPSLPTAVAVAKETGTRVLYETVDLVPEYPYRGERYRRDALALERALLGEIDGFITAADSYADYYVEKYGAALSRRPIVRDNMPDHIVSAPRLTSRPLQLLFLGSLMFDRPVYELIDAMALVRTDVTLVFQGKNYLGDEPASRVTAHGLASRVRIIEPCPAEEIVEVAARYDIGIVALRGDNENERRASTSKLFTYMSAGLAILGSDLPGISRVVNQYENGVLVPGMTAAAWAEAIEQTAAMADSQIDAMKKRSLLAAQEHSWERQRSLFIQEFLTALGDGDGASPQ